MNRCNLDKDESEIFMFPKEGFGIIDQMQGRVQFAILDQIKFMKTSGIEHDEINRIILANVQKIIENYQSQDQTQTKFHSEFLVKINKC